MKNKTISKESAIFRCAIFFLKCKKFPQRISFQNQKWVLIENLLLYTVEYVFSKNRLLMNSKLFKLTYLIMYREENSLTEYTLGVWAQKNQFFRVALVGLFPTKRSVTLF